MVGRPCCWTEVLWPCTKQSIKQFDCHIHRLLVSWKTSSQKQWSEVWEKNRWQSCTRTIIAACSVGIQTPTHRIATHGVVGEVRVLEAHTLCNNPPNALKVLAYSMSSWCGGKWDGQMNSSLTTIVPHSMVLSIKRLCSSNDSLLHISVEHRR